MLAATCIATTLEKRRPLPVDSLVAEPIFTSTHAITIAPTQALWARLGWIDTVLVTAFGLGLWKSAGGNRRQRIVGGLILAYACSGS